MKVLLGRAFSHHIYVFLGPHVEFSQMANSIQMELAHFLFHEVMHDTQAFVVSVLPISGAGIIWHAPNCSCIFEILGHLLV
jgi:hypothetical protein